MAVLVIVILFTALLTLVSLVRTPSFQQLAGRLASNYLSGKLHTEVLLDRVRISDFLFLEIHGLKINDHRKNEFIRVGDLRVKINDFSLRRHLIGFESVSIDSAGFFLEYYPGDSLLNLDYFLRGFQGDTTTTSTGPSAPWTIKCEEFTADGLAFAYRDDQVERLPVGMDFNNLSFSNIFLNFKDVSVIGDSISASIRQLSCHEQSGMELVSFSGDACVSASGISVKKALIVTNKSSLDLDLDFAYSGYEDITWFLDSVKINSTLRSSLVTLSDVGYFAPELFTMDDPVMVSGKVEGPVCDFSATDMVISLGDFTEFDGDVSMKGLPDIDSTFFKLDIRELTTTPEDIAAFNLPLETPNIVLPSPIDKLGFTTVTGKYEGYFSDFKTDLDIQTDVGCVEVSGSLSENNPRKEMMFDGNIKGTDVLIGKLTNVEDLGTVSLELEISGSASTLDDLKMNVNGWLEGLEYRNYSYEKIIVGGAVTSRSFDGQLMILDTAVNLGFKGLVDFSGDVPFFNFNVDLEKARFADLNLLDRSKDMDLKTSISANFRGTSPDSFLGNISINGLEYVENDQIYKLDHLDLTRTRFPGQPDSIRFRSDYLDGDIEGKFVMTELINQLTNFALGKLQEIDTTGLPADPQYAAFNFKLKDTGPITRIFLPFLEISPGMEIKGRFDSGRKTLDIETNTDEITVSGIKFKGVKLTGSTRNNEFDLDLRMDRMIFQENSDGTGLDLDNFSVLIKSGHDSVNYAIKWDNKLPGSPIKGAISGFVRFPSMNSLEAGIFTAEADFGGNLWRIEDKNLFTLDSASIGIKNLNIYNGKEIFTVDGRLTQNAGDTLSLYFKNWSLANFNPFLENLSLELSGIIDGRFGIFRNEKVTNIFAGIKISDFSFNEVLFGDAEFKTRWIESDQAVTIDLNIFSSGSGDNPYKILGVNGLYYPFDEKRNFDFDIAAQNLDISVLEPLLSSFSSHIAGFATGKLTLNGTNSKPLLLGKLKLQRAEMQVDYLNTIYSFSNEVVFKENMIQFSDLTVYDANSNTAVLTGGIKHNYFQDMSLDLTIKPDHFMAMNLDRYQNEMFYGSAFATGTVRLSGPFSNIAIDCDVKTEKGTKVSIPINYSVDVSQNDFIVFTNEADTMHLHEKGNIQVTGVSLNIGMNITNDADIEIFLPGNIGNIKARGNGNLRMGVDPYGYLTLNGSYIIQSGQFVFSLEQLVSRRFDILEGSKIGWTGDLNDAEVSIVARYRLRTSLEGLGISMIDPEAASQKVIVFTDIRMTGNLFNPDLTFGITFPNLQEQTKQAVYAVLDTNDVGIMNQQAISLLVLGAFSSTGSGGTNPVNPAAIVSSTLSNMLSQISNNVNIGINYLPGDQVSAEQLEVALSTQLLDDRLIIDGNIDVSGANASSQKTSSIVGDINVEYKLTPDGRFRVKAFNRANDLSIYNDYAPYTQGVGIFYRKEFNNLQELFTRSGSGKQKKEKK